jgi:hypothetical protein
MRQAFSRISRSRIALETGTHSPWVSRLLAELGEATAFVRSLLPGPLARSSEPTSDNTTGSYTDRQSGYRAALSALWLR